MSPYRPIKRWILPASGLSLAVVGLVFLFLGEAARDVSSGGVWASSTSVAPKIGPRQAWGPADQSSALLAPAAPAAPAAPVQRTPARPAPVLKPVELERRRPLVQETEDVLRVTPHLVKLVRAPGLTERLRLVEGWGREFSPEQATAIFSGLLDSELPGDFYEAENLRLYVLGELGRLPGARVEEILVARLDPERPRPERLAALELLASRGQTGRAELEAIARADHDLTVQRKARWALGRAH